MTENDKNKKNKNRRVRRPGSGNEGSLEEEDTIGQVHKMKGTGKKCTTRKLGATYKPETVTQATAFVKWAKDLGIDGLGALFRESLVRECPPTKPAPSYEANMEKNRFQDVICLEETRVKLVKEKPTDTDYIHANYVRFKDHDRTYITTQAPMESTMEDFWRMVVQEQAPVVVNLTTCLDEGKVKCAQYWPTNEADFKQYGRFTVTVKKKEQEDKGRLNVYVLEVLADGCSNSHIVRLIHSTAWPDGGVMESAKQVLRVIKQIYLVDTLAKGAIIIHCSAGIGRTGTMVLIDYTLYRIFQLSKPHNLIESFIQLREQRASSVQKECQFVHIPICCAAYVALAIKVPEVMAWADELEKNFKAKYVK